MTDEEQVEHAVSRTRATHLAASQTPTLKHKYKVVISHRQARSFINHEGVCKVPQSVKREI